jgi:integrase
MPLKLIPPRKGKTPYWSVRGTYLGRYLDRSTKARKRTVAVKIMRAWEAEIERGAYVKPGEPTFAAAALSYMKAGGERRFLAPIIEHFGNKPLRGIGQKEMAEAAAAFYPDATAATINRQLYTPVCAVLRHVGFVWSLARPEGADGRKITAFLWPEKAKALVAAAAELDIEFAIFLVVLFYCGLRLTEGLNAEIDNLRLAEKNLLITDTKNGEDRTVWLPASAIAWLRQHPRGLDRPGQRIFKFRKNGHLYSLLRAAAAKAEVDLPERCAFHIFCHTYGTLMRRYGNLDLRGLVATNRWKDIKSAERYTHAVASEESQRASLLPRISLPRKTRGKQI